jgi:hypothetical protein
MDIRHGIVDCARSGPKLQVLHQYRVRFLRQQMQHVCRTLHYCGKFIDIPRPDSVCETLDCHTQLPDLFRLYPGGIRPRVRGASDTHPGVKEDIAAPDCVEQALRRVGYYLGILG